jgi:uncharacterized protein
MARSGHPFPVSLRVYDETIRVLKSAVQKAKLGLDDKLAALKRLDEQARIVERRVSHPAQYKLGESTRPKKLAQQKWLRGPC